ncbi:MAG: ABC transporter ATP-binding protein [Dehalococcoidia bacterium]|nr:ABC transporter ATP-binding protein [Dehalococcoidia bacterium]
MQRLFVENICKVYRNKKNDGHLVLKDISFGVKTGEFVSLLGPSGCGKTTLLRLIAGFIQPTSGRVLVDGCQVSKPGPDRSFVFQTYGLFPWMTIKDNILYPMRQQKMPEVEHRKRLQDLLALANLEGKEDLYPHQLSGGMQQRIGVIRALSCRPKMLLMDEPLGAVDMQMRNKLQREMEQIFMNDITTVVMVTHDVDEAVFMSDRVLVMSEHAGQIVSDIQIPLQRPRNRSDKTYREKVSQLTALLQNVYPWPKDEFAKNDDNLPPEIETNNPSYYCHSV